MGSRGDFSLLFTNSAWVSLRHDSAGWRGVLVVTAFACFRICKLEHLEVIPKDAIVLHHIRNVTIMSKQDQRSFSAILPSIPSAMNPPNSKLNEVPSALPTCVENRASCPFFNPHFIPNLQQRAMRNAKGILAKDRLI